MTHPSFVDININNENGLLISNHGRKKVNFVLEQEILFSCSCDTFIIFITEEIFDFITYKREFLPMFVYFGKRKTIY